MRLIKIHPMMHLVLLLMMILTSTLVFSDPLKIGVVASGLPMAERANTAQGVYYYGFSIDIMNAICRRIGQTCTYSNVTLNNQFDVLDSGRIDALILAKPYEPEDMEEYAISLPYAVSKIQFVSSKNSPVNDVADIKNKKIGVIKSTFYTLLAQSPYHTNNQLVAYDLVADMMSDLAQNKIDVVVLNNAVAYSFLNNNFYNIKLVGSDIPLGQGYGIIALADKATLIANINKAILNMQEDGTYVSIYQKYYSDYK